MRILYVVHNIPPYETSGTPLIARQYAELAVARGHEVGLAFAAPADAALPQTSAVRLFPIRPAADLPWAFEAFSVPPADDPTLASLVAYKPDVVHVLDWVGLPSTVLAAAARCDAPVIRHVCLTEDVCSLLSPIWFHSDGRPCGTLSATQCGQCLTRKLPADEHARVTMLLAERGEDASPATVQSRLESYFAGVVEKKWSAFRSHVDEIYDELIFPSAAFRTYFESLFPLGTTARRVIPHGIDVPDANTRARTRSAGAPVRFTMIGWTRRKGRSVVEDCFARLLAEGETRARLSVHGAASDDGKSPLSGHALVEFHGPFSPDRIDSVLADTDVGLVPSVFESFNRVSREMLGRGIPVIASDAFGISDVVTNRTNGLLLDALTADDLYRAIRRILDSPTLLNELTAGARATAIRTPAEEFGDLIAMYERHLDARR